MQSMDGEIAVNQPELEHEGSPKKKARTDEPCEASASVECVVCTEKFEDPDVLDLTDGLCDHFVCRMCVDGCIREGRRTCPICRRDWVIKWMLLAPQKGITDMFVVPTYGWKILAERHAVVFNKRDGSCHKKNLAAFNHRANLKYCERLGRPKVRTFQKAVVKYSEFTCYPLEENVWIFVLKSPAGILQTASDKNKPNAIFYSLHHGAVKIHISTKLEVTVITKDASLTLKMMDALLDTLKTNNLLKKK